MLLSIDPGAFTGWALFEDRTLIGCGFVTPSNWGDLVVSASPTKADILLEEPTIYPYSKARPADIMALQLKVGELKGRFEAVGCLVELVQPRSWKGSVPKPVHNMRTFKALTDEERRLAEGKRHDVLDAIGLGLWFLKRIR